MPNFEIKHRWAGTTLYTGEHETTKAAVIAAVSTDADLTGAYLTGADLTRANLTGADLTGADLRSAYLTGADLRGADLTRANLTRADLTGADLTGADLTRAYLTGADLDPIRDDIWLILTLAGKREAQGLLAKINAGEIDGSTYEGACCCLVGTIANVRECQYNKIPGLEPDSSRPAERWFLAIRPGHTPDNSQVSKITAEWVEAWIAQQPEEI